jgi:L-2-hydroxyglutarate oxidase LhgO
MNATYDVNTIVIGAGVIGLAVARAIALRCGDVLVVERAAHVGTETSSRNSEVIHSGLYYTPGSLKAALCVQGRDMLYDYCDARSVPYRRTGKLIAATEDRELDVVQRYVATAKANGVGELLQLSAAEARRREPELRCVGALYSPYTGIVDSHALMTQLWSDLQHAGGDVVFDAEVVGLEPCAGGGFIVATRDGAEVRCRRLVNCGGLHAPELAQLLDLPGYAPPRGHYARGHYFSLSGRAPFSQLVYPVAESAGLGIHVTLDLAGSVRFGPDVEWCDAPDYAFDPTRRERFVAAIQRYYPALDSERLQPGYVGVRPKICGPGEPSADFRIDGPSCHGMPGLVHLFGIESPGLTACLALGDHVADILLNEN